jgi:predicted NAD/FAD-binding protein
MGAALALSDAADVTLFERADRFGGHANTVTADTPLGPVAVDTGFIVFNHRNYPNLTALFEALGVRTIASDMSFGFSLNDGALEYACDNLDTIFAQRRNVLNPRFLLSFREVLRFCRVAPADLASGAAAGRPLGAWLRAHGFSDWFRDRFILPMGGAIWSTPLHDMLAFPAESFLRFFQNHDLFTGLRAAMQWRTVAGGSREYVDRLIGLLGPRAVKGVGAAAVWRDGGKAHVAFDDGSQGVFDHVVLATHGPQARALLRDADDQEAAILGAFRTTANRAILHRDPALMPRRRKAWSSWNLLSRVGGQDAPVAVTYWMNRLQSLPRGPVRGGSGPGDLFVTLNPQREPAAERVLAEFGYAHPLYDAAAFNAQTEIDAVQGRGGVWHAGAWLGYGFHEDALRSGLRVAAALGARPDWARDVGAPLAPATAMAAQ